MIQNNKKAGGVTAKSQDQRRAKSERSKKAIAKAMLDLIIEGDPSPTSKNVADRAGVSARLVFHHFSDMEAVREEIVHQGFLRVQDKVQFDISTDVPFEIRLDRFLTHRTDLLELISPTRKAAIAMELHSKSVSHMLNEFREYKRRQVERIFAPELSIYSKKEAQKRLSALQTSTAWATWNSLRFHQDLSIDDARSVMKKMIQCIIGSV